MGVRFPIGRAGALASHGRMIEQKALRDKHFCCVNSRFLCIMLRDSHSLSFARPQVFPQAPPLIHSGAATRAAETMTCRRYACGARERVVD
jgi:hypothetical protein